jgi:hypothetical protein
MSKSKTTKAKPETVPCFGVVRVEGGNWRMVEVQVPLDTPCEIGPPKDKDVALAMATNALNASARGGGR